MTFKFFSIMRTKIWRCIPLQLTLTKQFLLHLISHSKFISVKQITHPTFVLPFNAVQQVPLTQSKFWIRNPISSRPLKCYSNLSPNHFIHLTFEFTSQYPLRNHFVHLTFEFTFYAPGIINFIQLTFEKLFTHLAR